MLEHRQTSTIVAAAKRMYGSTAAYSSMALELNASDSRGIDVVRNEIKEFAGTRQLFNKGIKLIILDEADAMTSDAQFALRRVIEKHTRNARFCLICNYVSKIIPALQSRCTRFRLAPLPRDVETALEWLLNLDFKTAYEELVKMCSTKGYALADIITDLATAILGMELPPGVLAVLLDGMSDVEHRLAFGTDEKLQTASLVGVFIQARTIMKIK